MIEFHSSQQSTLGLEWEVALVDRETGATVPAAPQVMESIERHHPEYLEGEDLNPHITREFISNTLEMVTGINATVAEAVDQIEQLMGIIREITDPMGVEIYSAGTHPTSEWTTEQVSEKERYQKVLDRTQYWGRQMLMYGLHKHIGLDSRDKALPVVNQLGNYYPHLLALSANSPFWDSHDTGYASQRAMIFQQIPTAGLPYTFEQWSDYEGYIADLLRTGVIDEPSENRWDIRPVGRYGTVEVRICDAPSSLEEIGALTALTQCIVEDTSRMVDQGQKIPTMPRWLAEENKWRAARYGTEAIVITDGGRQELLVTDDLLRLLNRLEPIAADLRCSDELAAVERIIERGPGYLHQLEASGSDRKDLKAVVAAVTENTRYGHSR